jgi:hypothetical protein
MLLVSEIKVLGRFCGVKQRGSEPEVKQTASVDKGLQKKDAKRT